MQMVNFVAGTGGNRKNIVFTYHVPSQAWLGKLSKRNGGSIDLQRLACAAANTHEGRPSKRQKVWSDYPSNILRCACGTPQFVWSNDVRVGDAKYGAKLSVENWFPTISMATRQCYGPSCVVETLRFSILPNMQTEKWRDQHNWIRGPTWLYWTFSGLP